MRLDAEQHVGKVSHGVDAVHLAGCDERVEACQVLAGVIAAHEEEVLAPERDDTECAFEGVMPRPRLCRAALAGPRRTRAACRRSRHNHRPSRKATSNRLGIPRLYTPCPLPLPAVNLQRKAVRPPIARVGSLPAVASTRRVAASQTLSTRARSSTVSRTPYAVHHFSSAEKTSVLRSFAHSGAWRAQVSSGGK